MSNTFLHLHNLRVSHLFANILIERDKYYHLYNRSNNNEVVFKEEENYNFFMKKYRSYCDPYIETIVYCLMPTHFHFLVRGKTDDNIKIQKSIAVLLSSYTKAINKRFERHGSLFQSRTRTREITDNSYLVTLISYIHQNPVRTKLVQRIEEWKQSSYKELIEKSAEERGKNETLKSLFDTP